MDKNEKYLLINAGSSSLKFKLYELPEKKEIVSGNFERIGDAKSSYTLKFNDKKITEGIPVNNHTEAANIMMKVLLDNHFISDINEISAVGHRVLLGGEKYKESVLIDDEVIEFITSIIPDHTITASALSCGLTNNTTPSTKDAIPKINVINQGASVLRSFHEMLMSFPLSITIHIPTNIPTKVSR